MVGHRAISGHCFLGLAGFLQVCLLATLFIKTNKQNLTIKLVDANGIVNVTAKDLGTNKEQRITITSNTNLSDEEIDKMMKEAEANKEADEKRKQEADARNEADQSIFATEKAIKDLGEKLTEDEKKDAEKLIEDLKESLKGTDVEDIKEKTSKLNEKAMEFASRVYQEAAQANQANEANTDDEATEAEFVNK